MRIEHIPIGCLVRCAYRDGVELASSIEEVRWGGWRGEGSHWRFNRRGIVLERYEYFYRVLDCSTGVSGWTFGDCISRVS